MLADLASPVQRFRYLVVRVSRFFSTHEMGRSARDRPQVRRGQTASLKSLTFCWLVTRVASTRDSDTIAQMSIKPFKHLTILGAGCCSMLNYPLLDGLLGQQVVILLSLSLWAMFEVVSQPHKDSVTEGALFRCG